jgi:hypothetical protein
MCCGRSRKHRPKRKKSHSGLRKGNVTPEPLPMSNAPVDITEEKKEVSKEKC